jgi:lipoyl-dependent peroxiredoxin
MNQPEKALTSGLAGKVVYTARTHTVGGRETGASRSSDGRLDVKLSLPGSRRIGTNPEQLFAAGWSACFESAIGFAARKHRLAVTAVIIDAEVDLILAGAGDYSISARFNISLPGIDRKVAEQLVEDAEKLCPYSKATHGNVVVVFNLI